MPNKELTKLLENLKKWKVYWSFIDNNWGADLTDMQLVSKFNKGLWFLWCVTDIFNKYAWVIPLKDKKGIRVANAFQKNIDESNRKQNKIWLEFSKRSMKSWLEKNAIEMYSTNNKRKSVVAERFIRTLKKKIYKCVTSISKNVYVVKFCRIVNNTAIHIIEPLKLSLLM